MCFSIGFMSHSKSLLFNCYFATVPIVLDKIITLERNTDIPLVRKQDKGSNLIKVTPLVGLAIKMVRCFLGGSSVETELDVEVLHALQKSLTEA